MKNVEFQHGLADVEALESCLLVLDDMMDSLEGGVADLFTKGNHPKNISVIVLMKMKNDIIVKENNNKLSTF